MTKIRVLLYEPESVGHRRIYLSAFLESWFYYGHDAELVCALNPDLLQHCEKLPREWHPNVVVAVSANGTSISKRFNDAKELARQHGCTEVFLLYGDSYLLTILREFPRASLRFSLLLFRYEVNVAKRFPLSGSGVVEMVRQNIKAQLVRFALECGYVNNILFLDPWATAIFQELFPGKVCFVPEPVRGENSPFRRNENLPGGQLKLLLLGTVDARKGLEEMTAAFELLPRRNRIVLQIVGRVLPSYKTRYESLLARLRALPHITLQLRNTPFEEKEIPAIIGESDIVAVLYGSKHIGMSSVFAWATVCRKPVLAANWGLIGFVTKAFKLGYLSLSLAPGDLASTLNIAAKTRFVEAPSVDRFFCVMEKFDPKKFLRDYFASTLFRSQSGLDMRQKRPHVY